MALACSLSLRGQWHTQTPHQLKYARWKAYAVPIHRPLQNLLNRWYSPRDKINHSTTSQGWTSAHCIDFIF